MTIVKPELTLTVNVDFVGEDTASKLPAEALFRNTSSVSSKLP